MDLSPLLSPRSVAVVGASQKGGRATGAVRNLLELGYAGGIYPVNPKYNTVLDLPCYPSLGTIPEQVDLVAMGVPSEHTLPILEEARRKGVRAAVIFASGYGEAGGAGRKRQAELEAFAARSNMLICGPNCLGVLNFHERAAGYSSTSPKEVLTGDVAVVSQSGTIIVALVRSLRGIGFSYLISSGNEATLTSSDYLRYLVDDPNTKVLAAFLEGINRPEKFIEAAEAARRIGKPLLIVKAGRSELGRAASSAHTGSLAGTHAVQRALFRQKSVVLCDDLDEWIEAIEIFRYARPPHATGVGLIGVSGGENALVLDHAADIGLKIPPLSEASKQQLTKLLPWYARPENPIDPTGAMGDDPEMYRKCLEVLAAEPAIGVVAVSQDSPAHFDISVAHATAQVARGSNKPFVFFSNLSGPFRSQVQAILRAAGVPYLQGIKESLKAIKALIDFHAQHTTAPAIAPLQLDDARAAKARGYLAKGGMTLTEDVSKNLLGLYGFPVVQERVVSTAAEAVRAAEALGYPVVAKVVSKDILHKAAIGGVRLGLKSPGEVESAVGSIRESIAQRQPNANIDGIVIQRMVCEGVEVILGLKRDHQFGSTIVFGLGGIFVEVIRQFSIRVAPIVEADARAMIEEVPALARLLHESEPGFDPVPLVAPLLLRLSTLAVELGDELEEVDMNPIILVPSAKTATVVDALIIRRSTPGTRPT
jgi:acetate---CoA ligase (ADP-forming)